MQTFKKFWNSKLGRPVKHRHMSAFDSQPVNRKSTDFVPKYLQPKQDNEKFVKLKTGASKLEYLGPADKRYLEQKFNCVILPGKITKLGNTGISAFYKDGKPVISK